MDPETLLVLNALSGGNNTGLGVATTDNVWSIIAMVLAVAGGIMVYYLFVAAKTTPKNNFLKRLKDFLGFKLMCIEPLIKILYYVCTIFTVLYSFNFLSLVGTLGGSAVLMFFMFLIGIPITIRIIYEAIIMFINIWHNSQEIADNTKKK